MRFEKENDFVEITRAISSENGKCEWLIDTNLDFESLPVELRVKVSHDNKEGFKNLSEALKKWANHEGFKLVWQLNFLDVRSSS